MAMLTIEVWDATGNKRRAVELPDDAPVKRILAVLLERMNFPLYGPDGQLLSYKFQHRASGKQLLDDQTLGEVGVRAGDVIRLMPEITAGAEVPFGGIASNRCDPPPDAGYKQREAPGRRGNKGIDQRLELGDGLIPRSEKSIIIRSKSDINYQTS